jgi:REP element-mobilizing transposase RayT
VDDEVDTLPAEVLGYLLTWTTYGTWLPGDARGWVNRHRNHGEVVDGPNPALEAHARSLMKRPCTILDKVQRECVEQAIRAACLQEGWHVHALAVRSNHVHVVVSAPDARPGKVMGIFKRQASKGLASAGMQPMGHGFWTRYGSHRVLNSEQSLQGAVRYVLQQDASWMKHV